MIYIITWDTESGDRGIDGYWKTKPTEEQIDKFIEENYPDDFEAKTIYYAIEELSLQKLV